MLGATNAGKSSFLNALQKKTTRFNEPGKMLHKTKLLTESPVPGTTLDFVKIDAVKKVGFKVFDTPGIPSTTTVYSRIQDYSDMASVLSAKRWVPRRFGIHQGYTLWLGALARIDFLSGTDKFLSVHVSPIVTIHRTPTWRAEEVFKEHAGKMLRPSYDDEPLKNKFKKHEINLVLSGGELINYDLSIEGLGWIGI